MEFDSETDICYVMGFMRADNGVFDYGFVAILDGKSQTIQNIRVIEGSKYKYLHEYKHWEMRIDLRLYKCYLMVKNAVVRYWRGLRLHNLLFHII